MGQDGRGFAAHQVPRSRDHVTDQLRIDLRRDESMHDLCADLVRLIQPVELLAAEESVAVQGLASARSASFARTIRPRRRIRLIAASRPPQATTHA